MKLSFAPVSLSRSDVLGRDAHMEKITREYSHLYSLSHRRWDSGLVNNGQSDWKRVIMIMHYEASSVLCLIYL